MEEFEKQIAVSILSQIKSLISGKTSGKVELILELNMNQGYVGSAFIRNNSKKCIFNRNEIEAKQ